MGIKVLYDDEIFFRQRYGGVSRVFSELLKNIRIEHDIELIFNCSYTENEYLLQQFPEINSMFKDRNFPLKGKMIRQLYGSYSHRKTNKKLSGKNIDIFHPTFYSDYYLNSLKNSGKKLIFTVHDLIHELNPGIKVYSEIAAIKRKNLELADEIIVVSNHTKKDLLKIYPFVKAQKVHIAHLAQSLPSSGIKPADLPEKYILFTGERSGYKNFSALFESFKQISNEYKDLHLFCAGSRPFNNEELHQIGKAGLSEKVHHKQLTDAELKYVYKHAEVFVFPSLYEGFGIPVLEAYASKVPVILSNAASLPEAGGDAAYYINAAKVSDLTRAIKDILGSTDLRAEMIGKGIKHEEIFSWQKHAAITADVYRKALL